MLECQRESLVEIGGVNALAYTHPHSLPGKRALTARIFEACKLGYRDCVDVLAGVDMDPIPTDAEGALSTVNHTQSCRALHSHLARTRTPSRAVHASILGVCVAPGLVSERGPFCSSVHPHHTRSLIDRLVAHMLLVFQATLRCTWPLSSVSVTASSHCCGAA